MFDVPSSTVEGSDRATLAPARAATRLIFLVAGLGTAAWAAMVPYAKARIGLDAATLGLVLLAMGFGSVVSMPLAGTLAHRWGYRRVIVCSGLLMCAALPLLALASAVWTLAATLFYFGFMIGSLDVAMNAHAVEVERRDGRVLMSGFHGLFSIGGLLGSGGMSALLALGVSLQIAVMSVALLLAMIVVHQRRRFLTSEYRVTASTPTRLRLPDALLLMLGLLCFACFMAEGAMLDWSAVFLRDVRALPASSAGLGYACFSVAMAVGRLAGDKVVARMGPVRAVRIGAGLAAGGLLMATWAPWAAVDLIGFGLVGIGASNIVPVMFSAAGRLPGRAPAMSIATVTALGYAGMLVGPALIGFVAQASSLSFALALLAALLLWVSGAAQIVRPR